MKKLISLFLAATLFVVCFVACKDAASTDAFHAAHVDSEVNQGQIEESTTEPKEEKIVSDEQEKSKPKETNKQETQQEDLIVPSKEDTVSKEQEKTESPKPEQHEASSNSSKVDSAVSDVQSELSDKEIHGDEAREQLTFVSNETFEIWLKKGSGSFEKERNDILQQATNQSFMYYALVGDLSRFGIPQNITYDLPFRRLCYRFVSDNQISLEIASCDTASGFDETYEKNKKRYSDNMNGYYAMMDDGITYYYTKGPNFTSILWRQFGRTHYAFVYQNRDKLEEIIPLLKLEQVTVNLNSDHVTQ